MKARSGRLGDFVVTTIMVLLGAGLIYGNTVDRSVGQIISDALESPLVSIGLGALLILSVLLRWVSGLGQKKKAFINFHSEEGNVGISVKAIRDFIERVGKEFAAVKSIDSTLVQKKSSVDVVLSVKVFAGHKIPELSQALQQRVRDGVRESLGLEEIRDISIKVQEIVGDPLQASTTSSDELNA